MCQEFEWIDLTGIRSAFELWENRPVFTQSGKALESEKDLSALPCYEIESVNGAAQAFSNGVSRTKSTKRVLVNGFYE
jgi:hypothetical protein